MSGFARMEAPIKKITRLQKNHHRISKSPGQITKCPKKCPNDQTRISTGALPGAWYCSATVLVVGWAFWADQAVRLERLVN